VCHSGRFCRFHEECLRVLFFTIFVSSLGLPPPPLSWRSPGTRTSSHGDTPLRILLRGFLQYHSPLPSKSAPPFLAPSSPPDRNPFPSAGGRSGQRPLGTAVFPLRLRPFSVQIGLPPLWDRLVVLFRRLTWQNSLLNQTSPAAQAGLCVPAARPTFSFTRQLSPPSRKRAPTNHCFPRDPGRVGSLLLFPMC